MEQQMMDLRLSQVKWQKSRRSGSEGGNCVEVARNLPHAVGLRDSKNPAPVVIVQSEGWSAFLSGVRGDAFEG
ncbi:hypothetical protein Sru01_22070 [Sphaerisporangium rufum]|uniref:DUF397 domain-containing protein n=1 Tax=Sphaerisporangium rufum TaxID=1381558 RepID=A0A919R4W7_9ACTN|nr:DUF397 domain-containing protein [Sphaerisporangium rufum]GII77225.1 hypothetical protein Sru01_22070 [Sphaerisporangium rufum]